MTDDRRKSTQHKKGARASVGQASTRKPNKLIVDPFSFRKPRSPSRPLDRAQDLILKMVTDSLKK